MHILCFKVTKFSQLHYITLFVYNITWYFIRCWNYQNRTYMPLSSPIGQPNTRLLSWSVVFEKYCETNCPCYEIHTVVKKHDFDVFCVCETWLGDQYKNDDMFIPRYSKFRKYRINTKGGGVCINVKDHLVVKTKNDLMFDEVGAIWLELNQGGQRNFLIFCIYRLPSSSQEYYSKIVDIYEKAQLDDFLIISMGDLNYDYNLMNLYLTTPFIILRWLTIWNNELYSQQERQLKIIPR